MTQAEAPTAAPRVTLPAPEPDLALDGSSYQTAPVTSLALARWPWALAGALLGAVLGVLAASGGDYRATATLQITGERPAEDSRTVGTTLEALVRSDTVLARAVTLLRPAGALGRDFAQAGGRLPGSATSDGQAKKYLADALDARYVDGTDLVAVAVTRSSPRIAIDEANAIAIAVDQQVEADADADVRALDQEFDQVYGTAGASRSVSSRGEDAEVTQAREALGQAKARVMFEDKRLVRVIRAAEATSAGVSRPTAGLLGAAGGAFLGALAAVAAGAGRRKPHSPRELMSLAPDLIVRTTVQAGELAGRVMETDRRTVVVLAMPDTRFAATQLGMAIAHHLRTHGATVALVDRVSEFSPTTAAEDRLWALRRDVRRNIPANFSADMLVVVCGADEEALSLIAGQSDLLVAVVAKQRHTMLADIRRTADAVRISEPVVVLAQ